MLDACNVVLGIDVGWAESEGSQPKKQSTAACLLEWTTTHISVTSVNMNEDTESERIDHLIADKKLQAVAIDGPLRKGLDEIGVYRAAEAMLTRGFQIIGKPGQSSSPNGKKLNRRANELAHKMISTCSILPASHKALIHDLAIVEAFPTSFLGVMLNERQVPPGKKKRSDMYYSCLAKKEPISPGSAHNHNLFGLVGRLLPGRLIGAGIEEETDHDRRAAVVCALTALCVAQRDYIAVGDAENGYIVLPSLSNDEHAGMQNWAWGMLHKNLANMTQDFPAAEIIVESNS